MTVASIQSLSCYFTDFLPDSTEIAYNIEFLSFVSPVFVFFSLVFSEFSYNEEGPRCLPAVSTPSCQRSRGQNGVWCGYFDCNVKSLPVDPSPFVFRVIKSTTDELLNCIGISVPSNLIE